MSDSPLSSSELLLLLQRCVEAPANLPGDQLKGALARLDNAASAPSLHPRLRHFLQNRSYAKALDFIRHGQEASQ